MGHGADPGRRSGAGQSDDVCWRQLGDDLWAGRSDGRPFGTIERNHGFVFVDVDGEPMERSADLHTAQKAATGAIVLPPVEPRRRPVLRVLASAAMAASAAALLLMLVWVMVHEQLGV